MVVICGATGFYFSNKPKIAYWSGLIAAGKDRIGWVAGSNVFQLGVPWHRQEHSLSCEVASLKMALDGVGVNVSEGELIKALAFDPTPKTRTTWGDPYTGFVGNIDGRMPSTGYGVYWDPIAKLGLRYVRTQALSNTSLTNILLHVQSGRPVIVWGYLGNGNRMAWTTPQGKTITAVNGEHAFVLIGWTGPIENPSDVILLDPIYGEIHWTAQKFMDVWSVLDRGAVVVYHQPRWVKTPNDNTVWEISSDNKTKYALSMNWETFINGGGVGEGINLINEADLDKYINGGMLSELTPNL